MGQQLNLYSKSNYIIVDKNSLLKLYKLNPKLSDLIMNKYQIEPTFVVKNGDDL